ncbi:hypothetical protein OAN13_08690, partial [Opitutales bacterium]|nr:hypothetical protein [Opitutales bacterium]
VLDLNSNMLTKLDDLSGLIKVETLGVSRNLIFDPSPVLSLPKLRRLTISFNQVSFEKTKIKDLLSQCEAKGVYINRRNQIEFHPQVQSLVRSLIGHAKSNELLGEYLRKHGYPRLIDFFLNQQLKSEEVDKAMVAWENALKFDKFLGSTPFPGK